MTYSTRPWTIGRWQSRTTPDGGRRRTPVVSSAASLRSGGKERGENGQVSQRAAAIADRPLECRHRRGCRFRGNGARGGGVHAGSGRDRTDSRGGRTATELAECGARFGRPRALTEHSAGDGA